MPGWWLSRLPDTRMALHARYAVAREIVSTVPSTSSRMPCSVRDVWRAQDATPQGLRHLLRHHLIRRWSLVLPLVALDAARPLEQLDHMSLTCVSLARQCSMTVGIGRSSTTRLYTTSQRSSSPFALGIVDGFCQPSSAVGWAVEMGCRDAREAFVATPRDPTPLGGS